MLTKSDILDYLRANKPFFRSEFDVIKIGIFGSYARNEQTDISDIDIIVEFEEDTENLYDKSFELKEFLSVHLKSKVDICREGAIKPIFKELILNDAVYV